MRSTLFVIVLLAAALVLAGPVQPLPPDSHPAGTSAMSSLSELLDSEDAVVIETAGPAAHDAVRALVLANGGEVRSSYAPGYLMSVSLGDSPESLLEELMSSEGVVNVSPERRAHILLTPDDPDISDQWGLDNIFAYDAWDISLGSHEVVVAVLDTGIDWNHQDLSANMWTNDDGYYGYNFVDDNWYPMDDNI
ncbi:MAG: S8 family serine peptidase, partial [Thermoplasmata archaeon]